MLRRFANMGGRRGGRARQTIAAPPGFPTWDAARQTNMTLSNGNLTATGTAGSGVYSIARSTDGLTSGKFYFEVTCGTAWVSADTGIGISTAAATAAGLGNNASGGALVYTSGNVWVGGAFTNNNIGSTANQTIGIAVDLDNKRVWFRRTPSDNWNSSESANPATNVGGYDISSAIGSNAAYKTFICKDAAESVTANFGATAFVGAVPAGFSGS